MTSTITFTIEAVADSPILRMADASVLGLTLSSADHASVPAGTSSSAVVTVPQVLALRGGGYAATIFVQDGTHGIFDSYMQVFGANGQPSGALLPFDGPEIVDRVPLAQITDGRFMAAWHPVGRRSRRRSRTACSMPTARPRRACWRLEIPRRSSAVSDRCLR